MIKPFTISPFTRLKNTMMERPFTILKEQTIRDPKEYFKWLDKCNEIKHRRPFLYKPFWYEDEKKEVEVKGVSNEKSSTREKSKKQKSTKKSR